MDKPKKPDAAMFASARTKTTDAIGMALDAMAANPDRFGAEDLRDLLGSVHDVLRRILAKGCGRTWSCGGCKIGDELGQLYQLKMDLLPEDPE